MELIVIGGLLAIVAFVTNIRLALVCVLLCMGGGWLYQQLPADQQKHWMAQYDNVANRSHRAWKAFWA